MTRLLVAALACLGALLPVESRGQDGRRTFVRVRWDSVGAVSDSADAPRLLNPQLVAAWNGDSAVVVDYGDWSIKAFDRRGRQLWKYGRRGAGPGEFGGIGSLSIGPSGLVWVADRGNARLYALSRDGVLRSAITLRQTPEEVLQLGDSVLIVWFPLDSALSALGLDGRRLIRRLSLPPAARAAHVIVRGSLKLTAVDREAVAIAFLYSSSLGRLSLTGRSMAATGIDSVPFPGPKQWFTAPRTGRIGPDPLAPRTVAALASDGHRLFALSAGLVADRQVSARGGDDASDVIDVYSARTLEYLGSWKLPITAQSMAWADGTLVLLSREPEPRLTFWRVRETAR